jgi:hypothetical protein
MYELTSEKIKENYDKFESMTAKLGDRAEPAQLMLEHFGARLALAPASSRVEHHSCFPGGLVDHSLRVLHHAIRLMKVYELSLPKESVILTSLFHDLGKVGNETIDYYIPQRSDWHRDKGMLYENNTDLQYMTVPHRSLYLLQRFNIPLDYNEYITIQIHDGQYEQANKAYAMKEPMLATILHQADCFSTMWEKENLK